MNPDQVKFLVKDGLEKHSSSSDNFEFRIPQRVVDQKTSTVIESGFTTYELNGTLGVREIQQSKNGDSFFMPLDALFVDARVIVNQSHQVLVNGSLRQIRAIEEVKQGDVTVQQVVILAQ